MNKRIFIPILILGFLFPVLLPAQPKKGKIAFTSAAAPREVTEGGTLAITFQITGSAGGQLRSPSFGAFRQSGGTQEMSGMQFSNGDVQAHHTWVFTLTAPAAGEYVIPEATAVVNGTAYTSAPLSIRVVPAGKGAPSGGVSSLPKGSDPNLFVTTEFSRSTAYVGQQVICTVNVYTRHNIAGIDLASVPKAGAMAMTELERYDMSVQEAVVGGVTYTKRAVFAAAFFPEKEGAITVPAVQVLIAVEPTNIFMPTRPVRFSTEPARIEVKPLPQPAPAGFTGVVGEYHVETKTDHDTAALGEAFICEISIRGNGNGRYFSPPKLALPAGLEVFDPVVKEDESFENGKELVHRQVLEYAIAAKQTGDYTCNPTIVWFDPDSSKYVSFSPELSLKVVESNPSGAGKVNALPQRFSAKKDFWTSPQLIGGVSLGLAALLLVLYFLFYKKKEHTVAPPTVEEDHTAAYFTVTPVEEPVLEDFKIIEKTEMTRLKHLDTPPSGHTYDRLQHLLHSDDPKAFYQGVYAALNDYFAQKTGVPASTIAVAQVTQWMLANGYGILSVNDVRWVFQMCEQALYAGQMRTAEMPLLLEKAKPFIA